VGDRDNVVEPIIDISRETPTLASISMPLYGSKDNKGELRRRRKEKKKGRRVNRRPV
jgi:hypothetical protein